MDKKVPAQNCNTCHFEDGSLLRGICAQATVGHSAFIFLSLVELLIKSQCSISDACRRVPPPTTSTYYEVDNDVYDFIVVGGGAAGSVVASRLSENPNHKVLLLEAGPEQPTILAVPVFGAAGINTTYDWQYETIPQKRAFLSSNGICQWPRGKMLCGTTCLSGLMYTRGHQAVYDDWAVQNKGWSYNEVLPYFKKSENNTQPRDEIDSGYHGFDGPLAIGHFPFLPAEALLMLDAAHELGYRVGADLNGKDQNAFAIAPIMIDEGLMATPARQYLRPVLHRPNLRVLINAHVVKITFDDSGTRATGVQYHDRSFNLHTVKATKEVIICGGVIGSPQLLMLSGIGHRYDLQRLGIKVVRDLPVGENLHHHVGVSVTARLANLNNYTLTASSLLEYLNYRTGPYSCNGMTQMTAFLTTKYSRNGVPDIQVFFDGCMDTCINKSPNLDIRFRLIYLLSTCRGTLKLRSSNPHDKPLIDPNYLCDETEELTLLEAVNVIRNLTSTKVLRPRVLNWNVEDRWKCPKYNSNPMDEDYWRCVIREYTIGENHHGGTCKMGPIYDSDAVVDNELRVHGIPNLRVADASIFPTPINCNTIAPTVMVGEKAAEMIKKTWET